MLRVLGQGGMGRVHLAEDVELDRQVAIKELRLPRSVPGVVQRFQREVRAMAATRHPSLVPLYDVVVHGEQPWMVMEVVEGQDLAEQVRRGGPVPVLEAARQAMQVAEALEALHRVEILHRDIKPSNILIRARDGRAMLTDLGLAVVVSGTRLTGTGLVVGTPYFMAPEVLAGADSSPCTEVYQAAATLFWVVTGDRWLAGEDEDFAWASFEGGGAAWDDEDERARFADLLEVLRPALSLEASERPPSAARWRDQLARVVEGDGASSGAGYARVRSASLSEPAVGVRGPRTAPRRVDPAPRPGLARVLVVLVLALGLAAGFLSGPRAPPPRPGPFDGGAVHAAGPALGEPRLAPGRALRVVAHRAVRVAFRQQPARSWDLSAGPVDLPAPEGPGPFQLRGPQGQVLATADLAALGRQALERVRTQQAPEAEGLGRRVTSGVVPVDELRSPGPDWQALLSWWPEVIGRGGLPAARRREAWAALDGWRRTMQAARVLDGPAGPRVDAVPGRVGWVGPQAAPPPSGALEPTIRPVRRASTDGAPDRWRVRPWLRDHLRPTAPADRRPGELALIWPGGVPAEAAAVGLRVRLAIVRFPHWVRFDLGHGLVVSTGHPGDDLREARSASTRVEVLMPPDLAPRPGDEVRVLVDRILLDHVAFRTRMAVLFEGFQVVWWERPLAPPLAGP